MIQADVLMTVWVTKYALTIGIAQLEVEVSAISPDMVTVRKPGGFDSYHGEGRDWHKSRAAAVKRAEQMRAAKIANLRKSISNLEKMSFDQ